MLGLSILALFLTLLDIFDSKKAIPKTYLINGSKLIYNSWSVKEFDLNELKSIRFMPFKDSFKLAFQKNKYLVINRQLFDNYQLSNFIQTAIQLNSNKIEIDEDAKNKIYT